MDPGTLDKALQSLFPSYEELGSFVDRTFAANPPDLRIRLNEITHSNAGLATARERLTERAEHLGILPQLEAAVEELLTRRGLSVSQPVAEEVDRGLQWLHWNKRFAHLNQPGSARVQMYLLPCTTADAPTAFVKRVKLKLEAQMASERNAGVRYPAIITWDSPGDLTEIQEEYRLKLFDTLRVPEFDSDQPATALERHLERFKYTLLESRIPVEEFGDHLDGFLRWLCEVYWALYQGKSLIVVFAHLECSRPPTKAWERDLAAKLGAIRGCPVTVLPLLEEILESHLEAWLGRFDRVDPEAEARTVLAEARNLGGSRMIHVIRSLDQWLERRRGK